MSLYKSYKREIVCCDAHIGQNQQTGQEFVYRTQQTPLQVTSFNVENNGRLLEERKTAETLNKCLVFFLMAKP